MPEFFQEWKAQVFSFSVCQTSFLIWVTCSTWKEREQWASFMDSVWIPLGILLSPASMPFSLFNLSLHNIIDGPKKRKDDITFWWISPIPFFTFQNLLTLLEDSWIALGQKPSFQLWSYLKHIKTLPSIKSNYKIIKLNVCRILEQ